MEDKGLEILFGKLSDYEHPSIVAYSAFFLIFWEFMFSSVVSKPVFYGGLIIIVMFGIYGLRLKPKKQRGVKD